MMIRSPRHFWLFAIWLLMPACSTVLNADFDGLTPLGTAGSSSASGGDAGLGAQGGSAAAGVSGNAASAGRASIGGAGAGDAGVSGMAAMGGGGRGGEEGGSGPLETGGGGAGNTGGSGGASNTGGSAGGAGGHGGSGGASNIGGSGGAGAHAGSGGSIGLGGSGGSSGYVSPTGVVLNELKGQGSGPDYIELYNRTHASLDIGGCYVSDDSNNRVTFPAGATIAATSFVLVRLQQSSSTGMVTSCFGYTPCYDGISWGISSSGEAVSLRDAKGTLLDQLTYPDQNGPSGLQDGQALGRVPDGESTVTAILVSPGAANNAVN
jgi:hypothetical protein